MSNSDLNPKDVSELISKLDQILDDDASGNWVHLIPIEVGVQMGLSNPQLRSRTIASVCRQVLTRMLKGEDEESIKKYLNDKIGWDDFLARRALSQTVVSAHAAAEMMESKQSRDEAMKSLAAFKNAEPEMMNAMLDMIQQFMREHTEYTTEHLKQLDCTPAGQGSGGLSLLGWLTVTSPVIVFLVLWLGFHFRWWTAGLSALAFIPIAFIGILIAAKIATSSNKSA